MECDYTKRKIETENLKPVNHLAEVSSYSVYIVLHTLACVDDKDYIRFLGVPGQGGCTSLPDRLLGQIEHV